jgi:hypothetical protein
LSALEHDEDKTSTAIPRAEKAAHEIFFRAVDRLKFEFIRFCLIVGIHHAAEDSALENRGF